MKKFELNMEIHRKKQVILAKQKKIITTPANEPGKFCSDGSLLKLNSVFRLYFLTNGLSKKFSKLIFPFFQFFDNLILSSML